MNKQNAKDTVEQLVERFGYRIEEYKKGNYNETQTRNDFINPFFESLGWDINNKLGQAEVHRDVIHEDKIKIGGKTKAPDYCFTNLGNKQFFLEAKKPIIDLKEQISPAYQLRRYGWSAKLPISILTDFEEFAIYDCSIKPSPTDKPIISRIKYLEFSQYVKEFDFLWETFSKEMVLKGSIDKYFGINKGKKVTSGVDAEFLKSLDSWRDLLARDIVIRNNQITEDELNYSLQKIMDRIIFLRICEDRGVEKEEQLFDLIGKDIYKNIKNIFHQADQKYNSGLFDYRKDLITDNLNIDDKVLATIIEEMYYPKSPYEFSVIPVEILGHSYEQYLGKVIKIDTQHNISIEEKPEVRKAGGVYYTPQYIVDYIVKNTVGKIIEGKTPDEVTKIKICDPACGSGSFLLGAYQYLLDWHLNYYMNADIKRKDKFINPYGNLTTQLKKSILLNNIFGVDIDTNAVEVTKLSLMLKAMEGETDATISSQMTLLHERVLPTLDNNIKSGNSLIDTDFYDNQIDFEPGAEKKIKPFNWELAFPEVFKQGGFDVVIGNPPYSAELDLHSLSYLKNKYPIGNTDTAAIFMVLSKNILKEKGFNSFIIPKPFTYASNWIKIREILLPNLTTIVDCSKVWKEVKLEMTVYNTQKGVITDSFESNIRNNENIIFLGNVSKKLCNDFGFILNGVSDNEIQIGEKIKNTPIKLNEILINQRGGMFQKLVSDIGDTFVLGGKQINRYSMNPNKKGKLFISNLKDKKSNIKRNSVLVQNIVAHIMNPKPHLQIISTIIEDIEIEKTVILDTINQLEVTESISNKFILGLLNSKLLSWYVYKFIFANAIRTMHFDSPVTSRIPIPQNPNTSNQTQLIKLVDTMLQLNKDLQAAILPEQKEQLQSRIKYTDNKIDQLVYQLYELTEDEIKIVEGE